MRKRRYKRILLTEKHIPPTKIGAFGTECWFNEYGLLHSKKGKPAIISYWSNGNKMLEEWYKNGIAHRERDKPTEIHYFRNGNIEYSVWKKYGEEHREGNKPSSIMRNTKGKIRHVWWCKNGKLVEQKNIKQTKNGR